MIDEPSSTPAQQGNRSPGVRGAPAPAAKLTFADVSRGRDNNCDFVRFMLAALVVLAHAFLALDRGTVVQYDLLNGASRYQTQLGHLAVHGFFTISGALILASWERSTTLHDFIRNRVLRIYPGFIACYLLCLFVVAPLSGLTWQAYVDQLNLPLAAIKMLLLRGFGGFETFPNNAHHMLNGSLWTIPFEFGCYLLIAMFAIFGRYRRQAIPIGAAIAYVLYMFRGLAEGQTFEGVPSPLRAVLLGLAHLPGPPEVCLFLFGAVFHQTKHRIPFSGKLALLALGLTAVAFRVPPTLQFVLPFTLPYLVFFVVYHPQLKLHGFGKRADLSYGIYLWGWPVEQMLVRFFEPQLNGVLLFLLALPLTAILALASWKLVEAPFLRLKRRRAPSAVTASATT